MAKKELQVCPLMSVGSGVDMVCIQDKCAWYVPSMKKCSVYMIAYNALLEASARQSKQA
ncbi:MAG: hypothetical protein LBK53_06945 [Heliobacteriaceae bacterium]|jgi:hypothetical protein|nr:hypothetical protein [Heliobacteriaceae bacterium]